MDKNGNTDHTGGGLTFSGGPYTFTPTSLTPIQIKSPLPAILFNETDVTNASGSIGVDSGVLKLVYGNSLSSNTKGLLVDSSGRVGVGTASPGVALHITNQTAQFDEMLRLEDVTTSINAPQIGFYKSNSRKAYQQINNDDFIIANSTSNGDLRFLTNNSNERMRIDSAGNVGIGTASPVYKLTLNSSRADGLPQGVGTDGTVYQTFSYQTSGNVAYSGTLTNHMYALITGNVGRLFITDDGSVGIGTASPGVALDVYGEARSFNSTTSASNAKTLTTKDFVTTNNRIGGTAFIVVFAPGHATANTVSFCPLKNNAGTGNKFSIVRNTSYWGIKCADSGEVWQGCVTNFNAGDSWYQTNISSSTTAATVYNGPDSMGTVGAFADRYWTILLTRVS
jgi:hypothetical protein